MTGKFLGLRLEGEKKKSTLVLLSEEEALHTNSKFCFRKSVDDTAPWSQRDDPCFKPQIKMGETLGKFLFNLQLIILTPVFLSTATTHPGAQVGLLQQATPPVGGVRYRSRRGPTQVQIGHVPLSGDKLQVRSHGICYLLREAERGHKHIHNRQVIPSTLLLAPILFLVLLVPLGEYLTSGLSLRRLTMASSSI